MGNLSQSSRKTAIKHHATYWEHEQKVELERKQKNMRYLITTKETYSPFLTKWFEPENHFNADLEMIVYDLVENKYTTDGKKWHEIKVDHL